MRRAVGRDPDGRLDDAGFRELCETTTGRDLGGFWKRHVEGRGLPSDS